jgi:hypothetical protein
METTPIPIHFFKEAETRKFAISRLTKIFKGMKYLPVGSTPNGVNKNRRKKNKTIPENRK